MEHSGSIVLCFFSPIFSVSNTQTSAALSLSAWLWGIVTVCLGEEKM